jgi:uncharacterized Tic20 family protein
MNTDNVPTPQANELSKDEKNWGMFCHLSSFIGFIIPFGNIIGPLVLWLMKKDEYAFVDDQGKEALNFQITVGIAFIVCFLLTFVVIGIFLMFVVGIFDLVVTIMAIIKSSQGEYYRYPISIRLVK